MTQQNTKDIAADFSEIAPYSDSDFHQKMAQLVKEPGFEHAVKYAMPDVDFPGFVDQLLSIHSQNEFQAKVMWPFLEMLAAKTTDGVSIGGLSEIESEKACTFITNHRDIVLDASFLNLSFLRNKIPTTEIAIGNNLLIYEWIADLVKLNKSFIVKRDVKMIEALRAAKQLSAYIHWAITHKGHSVWIAQREGRAKDSNDLTQESLVKMLALAGDGDTRHNLMEINLVPASISYEFDPNDYLKAKEFLMKRRDPNFKKSKRDDLFSMETGMLQYKGHVHIEIGKPVNLALSEAEGLTDKAEVVKLTCRTIDNTIHRGYRIYPINYVAYDRSHKCDRFADMYTDADKTKIDEYLSRQLDKVVNAVGDVTAEERTFMLEKMLDMYANPLRNKLRSSE